ncbi:MAG: glycine--tRNA ligase subunit beta [Gammaproteobacteria bacterium]|nr:glycine--tRNA ligase subunit beta [Gammaproteobacteria bacterium]
MSTKDLLFEIGVEELPAKNLKNLSTALSQGVQDSLKKAGLNFSHVEKFCTPRRLAVIIKELDTQQAAQIIERRGPAVSAPSEAINRFAQSCGIGPDKLTKLKTDKGEWFIFNGIQAGKPTTELLPDIINEAIKKLPIPKPMRWSDKTTEFSRPVHWIVLLFGNDIVEAEMLGKKTGRTTYGHRFLAPEAIELKNSTDYETSLNDKCVIANFDLRRDLIKDQITTITNSLKAISIIPDDLLDEVTALVEYPTATLANFDPKFLTMPQEALISAMHGHQKSFPIEDAHGKLLPHFIFVSNLRSKYPQQVVSGNEKVMRARLSDAKFFYDTDTQHSLENFLPRLKNVMFQAKLGTMYERIQRISTLAGFIARQLKLDAKDVQLAERAGELCKADLMSGMVNEFPELQGIMGYYYSIKSGEDKPVAKAIRAHYQPTFSGDHLPSDAISQCVALADKIDLLIGIFGINQAPTGDKDPFALRRAAIGIVRILTAYPLDLDLQKLLTHSAKLYQDKLINTEVVEQALNFIYERMKALYLDRDVSVDIFNAVRTVKPTNLDDFSQRIKAVEAFRKLPEAENLAAANKRVLNILTKQNALNIHSHIDTDLLQLPAEQKLFAAIQEQNKLIEPLLDKKDYADILSSLAHLRMPIDQFFDDVMVMVDDEKLRHNRLLLLNQLRQLFLTVADISLLSN